MALETFITATGNALAVTITSWTNVATDSAALGFNVFVAITKVLLGT